MSDPILVMGATGNAGGAVLAALRERGVPVRALSRSARDWPDGVEGVVGDPGDAEALRGAATGAGGAFLMAGYAAEATLLADLPAGAPVVLLSSSSADLGASGNAMGAYHLASETAVKASGHPWTMLRPCSFQANVTRWDDQLAAGDVLRLPFADVPVAMVDPADIGAVAATALTEAGHDGRTYRLSGPEALTPADQVAILAAEIGRPLSVEPQGDDEVRAQMGEPYGAAIVEIFRGHPELESEVQPTVQEVLGRPPGTLAAYVRSRRDRWSR